MRALLFLLAACGGGASFEGPGVAIGSLDCSRLGPDNTGFMIEGDYEVGLDEGQALFVAFTFPTSSEVQNRSDIYNCSSWTSLAGDVEGCQRDAGQPSNETVFHSLAIEFADPVPPPATVMVTARIVPSPEGSLVVAEDGDSVDCN
jgi:hypothetical protein